MRSVNAIKASVLEFQRLQSFNENDEMMFFYQTAFLLRQFCPGAF